MRFSCNKEIFNDGDYIIEFRVDDIMLREGRSSYPSSISETINHVLRNEVERIHYVKGNEVNNIKIFIDAGEYGYFRDETEMFLSQNPEYDSNYKVEAGCFRSSKEFVRLVVERAKENGEYKININVTLTVNVIKRE